MRAITQAISALYFVEIASAQARPGAEEHWGRSNGEHTYGYIIVGAGISGLVVANRLTEDRKSMWAAIGNQGVRYSD